MSDPTTWADAAKTAATVSGPIVAGLLGYLLSERSRRGAERNRVARENLRDPIKHFMDQQLTLVSRAYWNHLDGRDAGVGALLEEFREREAVVGARVHAIRDVEVERAFTALTDAVFKFRGALGERDDDSSSSDPHELKNQAMAHGGELLRLLYR